MASSHLPKTVAVSIIVVLLGLILVSSPTLASIGFIPLLHEAAAQQFDDEVQGQERREQILRTPPLPDPALNDPNLRIETVFRGLEFPTAMAFLGEDDILVTEKDSGQVQRIINGELQEEPAIDVPVANNNMRGLLGIAVSHSNGVDTENGAQYVFLYFTESGGGEDGDDWSQGIPPEGNRLYRYNIASENGDNEQIQLVDETLILDLPATPGPRFNGGPVAIGPDNNVYVIIGTVDHRRTQAQNIIDGPEPDGSSGVIRNTQEDEIEDVPGVISDEVPLNLYYAYGIRSSFGMAFDPVTGNLWDTENGPECCDEINLVEPGFNSGWQKVSGLAERQDDFNIEEDLVDFDGRGTYSDPKFVWQQPVAVTGMAFLDSSRLGAEYQDDLFVGDFNHGRLYHFKLNEDRTELILEGDLADRVLDRGDRFDDILFGTGFGGITDVKVGPDGFLYVLAFHAERGSIFKIVPDDEEVEEEQQEEVEEEQQEEVEEEDIIRPTVVSTNPDDGDTDVAVTTTITATFSEDVTGVDEDSFTVNNGTVQGDVTYDSATDTTTFTSSDDLEHDTEYTASLSSAIEDLAGNELEDIEWSFTTIVQEEQPEEVEDTTLPTLIVPEDMVVEATSEDGTEVRYIITAEDDVDGAASLEEEDGTTITQDDVGGDITISCDPSSGSMFPIGNTTVQCSATDTAGNEGTASFMVTVEQAIDEEIEQAVANASSTITT
ncbi:MAG: PQQ-dependent sugar dehydrogenase [Thermoproteota archaeon]|nr:PQQ-dependent sugar dehydrogenase [Thermoproteota archaeon]